MREIFMDRHGLRMWVVNVVVLVVALAMMAAIIVGLIALANRSNTNECIRLAELYRVDYEVVRGKCYLEYNGTMVPNDAWEYVINACGCRER